MYDEDRPYTVMPDRETTREYRQSNWDMASGLQAVDGLSVSDFAQAAGQRYIDGEYTAAELRETLEGRYVDDNSRQAEADVVTSRIVSYLESSSGKSFKCEPETLKRIHFALFDGVFEDNRWAGQWRQVNISKAEPVLGGRSVEYEDHTDIQRTLAFDFSDEALYEYTDIRSAKDIEHFAKFIANVWEVHPFREGNTRAIAAFAQSYLNSFGVEPDNELFKENSTWFRDALVRAAYGKSEEGISSDYSYITMFFENVLGADHDLQAIDLNCHGIRVGDVPYR